MKKILLILFLLCFNSKLKAITDIKIDNENLSPFFEKDIYRYNYYTDKDTIKIEVLKEPDENVNGYGVFNIESLKKDFTIISNDKKYIITVFKNYKKNNKSNKLINLEILGYEINFKPEVHEYDVNIFDEQNLNIKYEVDNYDTYVSIDGNGNFNKDKNIITINVDNKEKYIINVYKTLKVSYIQPENDIKQMSYTKKELVKILLIIICFLLIYGVYKIIFTLKINLNILRHILHK